MRTAALLQFHGDVSGAPVVSAAGKLIGVLSERDLLAKETTMRFALGSGAAAEDRRRHARTAGQACTRPARATVPDARLSDVARDMLDHDVSRLVVIDQGAVAGIISRHDVLAALLREDADARDRYGALKRRNAELADRDMDMYVAAKAKFVAELLTRARTEHGLPPAEYWEPPAS